MSQPNHRKSATPQNLWQVLDRIASLYPDKTAYRGAGGQGAAYTYAEVRETVRRRAAAFQTGSFAGLTEIGLLSENRPEWPMAYLSVVAAGKTVVPLDANLKPNELEGLIRLANLPVVIASSRFSGLMAQLTGVAVLSLENGSDSYWLKQSGDPAHFRDLAKADDVAVLIYTSGTTGKPKAVQLTHRNLTSNLESVNRSLDFGPSDIWYSVLPLHHTFEATCGFLAALDRGATVVYARSLKSRDIIEDIRANQATVMCGVPLLFEKMYQSLQRGIQSAPLMRRLLFKLLFALSALGWAMGQRWGRGLFSALRARTGMDQMRLFVSGGAPLPPHISRFFNLIGFGFLQGYGLTECSPVVSVNRPHDIEFGSVGPPLEGLEVRIGGADSSGVGEILIRGDNVTPGYKNNPEKTAELLDGDGWLHTGDLGCLKNGHLWITGRAKNLIVSAAGKNIYPEELEEKLCGSPLVLEALVSGVVRDGKHGEEVRAVIVPNREQFATEFGLSNERPDLTIVHEHLARVVAEVNRQVADYKRIAGFEIRMEELEKTSTKKVKRFLYQQGRAAFEEDLVTSDYRQS